MPHFTPTSLRTLLSPMSVVGSSGGANVNKRFYLFGGEYYDTPPTPFSPYSYDTLNDWWDNPGLVSGSSINPVSYGAGVGISELGLGFYYGGWLSSDGGMLVYFGGVQDPFGNKVGIWAVWMRYLYTISSPGNGIHKRRQERRHRYGRDFVRGLRGRMINPVIICKLRLCILI